MSDQHYFIFREPENFDELKSLLLLRYSIYRSSRLKEICIKNDAGIDLDCYDLYARHFGLYEHSGSDSRPVGYIRMISSQVSRFRDELYELGKGIPELYAEINRIPKHPMALIDYCPDRELVKNHLQKATEDGRTLIEASRLVLDRSISANAIAGFRIAQSFVSAVYASFLTYGVDECFVICNCNHEALYKGFGAIVFPGSHRWYNEKAGVDYSLFLLSAENLPEQIKERVSGMSEAYRKMGRICYNPTNPGNYLAPLGSYLKSRSVFTALAA